MKKLPQDLIKYFKTMPLKKYKDSRINPLTIDQSLSTYEAACEYDPVVTELGFIPLDDANDSNPYGYLTKTPLAGHIMHYNHDGDRRIKFSTISQWVDELNRLGENNLDIDEAIFKKNISCPQMELLIKYIIEDYDPDSCFFSDSTTYLVSCLNHKGIEAAEIILKTKDFFIKEELAKMIQQKPHKTFLEVAKKLSKDNHEQVSRPGKLALKQVNRLVFDDNIIWKQTQKNGYH